MLSACYYSILITYSTALLFPRYSPLAPLPAHAKIPPRLLERHLTQRSRSEAAPSSRAPARAAVLPSALPARIWVQRGHHPSAGPSPSAAHTPCTASGAPAIHDQGRRTPRRTRAPGAAFVFVSLWLKEKRPFLAPCEQRPSKCADFGSRARQTPQDRDFSVSFPIHLSAVKPWMHVRRAVTATASSGLNASRTLMREQVFSTYIILIIMAFPRYTLAVFSAPSPAAQSYKITSFLLHRCN